jgi:hypothetical protein
MHDAGYVLTGYAATAAVLAWYRWRLARRGVRARRLTGARSRSAPTGPRSPR